MNRLAVLLDVSPLGCPPAAKTGLARVAESLAFALEQRPLLAISTCAFGSVAASAAYAAQADHYAQLAPIGYSPTLLERVALRLQSSRRVAIPGGAAASHRLGQFVNLVRNPLRGVDVASFDVVHSTYARFPRRVRALSAARVITIHDIIGLRLPEAMVPKGQAAITRRILRSIQPQDWVACVSEHTRQDFLAETGHPESRTVTIHNAVDHDVFRPIGDDEAADNVLRRFGLGQRPYLLTLSSLAAHKNLGLTFRAWSDVRQRHPDARLVVAGGKSTDPTSLMRHLGVHDEDSSTIVTGFLTDTEFVALASRCNAFLFPSLYEGFGLPPLEAMACGAPVIVSNASSLPEVVGDAGTLLDPHDAPAWQEAMRGALAAPPSAALRGRGIKHACQFTWATAATEYESLYRRATAERTAA